MADQEALRRFYMSHGYADFQVLSVDHTFDEAKGRYHVTFTLEEGPRYVFGLDQRRLVDPGRRTPRR